MCGLRRFSVRNTAFFSCARPMNSTPSSGVNPARYSPGQVVLALASGEVHQRHLVLGGEPVDVRDEGLADRVHQRGRGELVPQVGSQEADHPERVLQPRLIHVEIHPVDALHLEVHVLIEDIRHRTRYRHRGLRSVGRAASRPTNRFERFIHRTGPPVTVAPLPPDRSPEPPAARLAGWGGAPLVVRQADRRQRVVVVIEPIEQFGGQGPGRPGARRSSWSPPSPE